MLKLHLISKLKILNQLIVLLGLLMDTFWDFLGGGKL